jgi:hypothetical protein
MHEAVRGYITSTNAILGESKKQKKELNDIKEAITRIQEKLAKDGDGDEIKYFVVSSKLAFDETKSMLKYSNDHVFNIKYSVGVLLAELGLVKYVVCSSVEDLASRVTTFASTGLFQI